MSTLSVPAPAPAPASPTAPGRAAAAAPKTTAADITAQAVRSFAATPDERTRELLQAAVRHLHAFAVESRLTTQELIRLAEILTAAGKISDPSRHEFLLMSDVLGLTMVVDYNTNEKPPGAFESSVLGPFYRTEAPWVENGGTILRQPDPGLPAHVSGRVRDLDGNPVAGAVLDVWQVNSAGNYENVDPAQCDFNLRGRLRADGEGRYRFWTVQPVPYPIPKDGPAGLILDAARRHNMRPAHLHVIVEAPGYETVISELFTRDDPYVDDDSVFGVKDTLKVDYVRRESPGDAARYGRPVPFATMEYDFVLVPGDEARRVRFSADR